MTTTPPQIQLSHDDTALKPPELGGQQVPHTDLEALERSKAVLRQLALRIQPPAPTTPTMASPTIKALSTNFDVLHNILIFICPYDLLINCLRVSRFWNSTISNSPVLQQELHFQLMPEDRQLFQNGRRVYSICGFFTYFSSKDEPTEQGSDPESRARFHKPLTYAALRQHGGCPYEIQFSKVKYLEAFARPEASWRKMLLVQPPLPLKHYFWHYKGDYIQSENRIVTTGGPAEIVRYNGHERLGEVYEYWKNKDWTWGIVKDPEWWTPEKDLYMFDSVLDFTYDLSSLKHPDIRNWEYKDEFCLTSWVHRAWEQESE
ncbi:hypothetical protein HYALB_00002242 [Hymenoscyphus albidus]|uniref:F-box domain-containing protein n=1 Tax=Hymenoscyphus albidus TaxID=595503 RepID=A0A9N9LJE2_9HELO|nr:hypothetical protein HYALB_00002242 [Hymenoscyphus albidus]